MISSGYSKCSRWIQLYINEVLSNSLETSGGLFQPYQSYPETIPHLHYPRFEYPFPAHQKRGILHDTPIGTMIFNIAFFVSKATISKIKPAL